MSERLSAEELLDTLSGHSTTLVCTKCGRLSGFHHWHNDDLHFVCECGYMVTPTVVISEALRRDILGTITAQAESVTSLTRIAMDNLVPDDRLRDDYEAALERIAELERVATAAQEWKEWRDRNGVQSASAHERGILDALTAVESPADTTTSEEM